MAELNNKADVIVVGAGIAGLTAAREVEAAGLSTLTLEASSRVGGRLYGRRFVGTDLELEYGGNLYSRDFQPRIAAEYVRYGLEAMGPTSADRFVQVLDGERVEGTAPVPDEQLADLERALVHWLDGVRRVSFDRPFDEQDIADLDVSVADYFAPLDLPRATRDFVFSWPVHCNGEDPDRVSALHMMRWFAGFGNSIWNYYANPDQKWRTSEEYLGKLVSDIRGRIALDSPVSAIEQDDDGVTVTTAAGEAYRGGTAILAVPINSWRTVAFTPELPEKKARAAREGHIGTNKVFVRANNVPERVFGTDWEAGIGVVMVNNVLPDGSKILWAFVNGRRIDASDPRAVEAALQGIFPEIEVIAVDREDFRENDYRGGGLTAFAPGQLTSFDSALREPTGRVFFATSDIDQMWAGWLEGALRTSAAAAGSAVELLAQVGSSRN